MEQWDGTERRHGDRRQAQRAPYQEYPKMVHGQIAQSAEHEADIIGDVATEADKVTQPKARKAGKKK